MKHPIQPLSLDPHNVVRFKPNAIVRYLLDAGPFDMNNLALLPFTDDDRGQFAQLIGYSLSGFGELDYVSDATYEAAEKMYADSISVTCEACDGAGSVDFERGGASAGCDVCGGTGKVAREKPNV